MVIGLTRLRKSRWRKCDKIHSDLKFDEVSDSGFNFVVRLFESGFHMGFASRGGSLVLIGVRLILYRSTAPLLCTSSAQRPATPNHLSAGETPFQCATSRSCTAALLHCDVLRFATPVRFTASLHRKKMRHMTS